MPALHVLFVFRNPFLDYSREIDRTKGRNVRNRVIVSGDKFVRCKLRVQQIQELRESPFPSFGKLGDLSDNLSIHRKAAILKRRIGISQHFGDTRQGKFVCPPFPHFDDSSFL